MSGRPGSNPDPEPRQQPGVDREYAGDGITVLWESSLCVHSANCLRGLPRVFRADARPWVRVDAGSADDIARVIMTCPSGALRFERTDGGPQELVPAETTTVFPVPNASLVVRGNLEFLDAEGRVIRTATRATLCRCGQSRNKPFCDLSHLRAGFRAD